MRRSSRSSVYEYFVSLFLYLPYRCKDCRFRFRSNQERKNKLLYATCPHCGNQDLQRISPRKVPVRWFKALQRLVRRRAYRCDVCRWRFFDRRRLAPPEVARPHSAPAAGAEQRNVASNP